MIKLQCINCGHIKNYLKSDLVRGDTCDLCGGLMVLPKEEKIKATGDNFPLMNKDYYTIEEAIDMGAYIQIKKAIKRYGLEGTEDVIKRVYLNTQTQQYFLKLLYEIWKG